LAIYHSRKDNKNLIAGEAYFGKMQMYGSYMIYIEVSNEWNDRGGISQIYSYWCINMSSGEKVRLEVAHRIDNDKIVGILKCGDSCGKLCIYDVDDLFQ